MIDSGADVIVGGHPHVTQNIEIYQGKPIFYSLGNFVFDGFKEAAMNTGWVLTLVLATDGSVKWTITEARIDHAGLPSAGQQFSSN